MHVLCIHLSTMIISVSLRILETWSRGKDRVGTLARPDPRVRVVQRPNLFQLSSLRDESCSPHIIVLNCTRREWERDGLGWSSSTSTSLTTLFPQNSRSTNAPLQARPAGPAPRGPGRAGCGLPLQLCLCGASAP